MSDMKANHELKTWMEYFAPIVTGQKTFEYRFNDRGFMVGDLLLLREYNPHTEEYTGRAIYVRVDYILDDCPGLKGGYVVMSITPVADLSGVNVEDE
jgi:hypothetical protein